jgi:hypothetical protein
MTVLGPFADVAHVLKPRDSENQGEFDCCGNAANLRSPIPHRLNPNAPSGHACSRYNSRNDAKLSSTQSVESLRG